ncbi:MAG: tRNA1(Val) (adenine(37)-N6)-methyltransferase [Clostridia bacterium]|nr:tRNA1(Val) (adenine(37)-N6)-methyltransferase [Clostridia bacterium]
MRIFEDETLEDLQIGGLSLIQKKTGFRFGIDAVLLSDFAKDIPSQKTLDLCTGNGIIPILLSAKSDTNEIFGLEIQESVFDTAIRSVELNSLQNRVFLTCGDVKNAAEIYGKRQFDLITCNPPYMPKGRGIQNPKSEKIIARHEVLCTLEDIIRVSAQLLKHRGHLLLVHKPSRLADIIFLMRQNEIEPKRIRFIHKSISSEPSLILVDGSFKGGKELRIMPPLYLYNDDGSETDELREVYGR